MDISLVVAAALNGTIGINNTLPWHLPEDLRYFKQVTMGKPIIMGRKTYESIGRPLPGRTNIVISHNKNLSLPESVLVAASADEALALAAATGVAEAMIIGGEQVYQLFMARANRLYLTEVKANIEGDAQFIYNKNEWRLVKEEQHFAAGDNPYDYRFCVLDKKVSV